MRLDPNPHRPKVQSLQAGFTLIEALAALVVITLIVAVVLPYAGRLATRWWAGETAIGMADGWMQAVARMSDDLAEAVPLGLGPDEDLLPAFRASSDAIMLVRPALGRLDALETITYEVRSSPAGQALIRLSRPFVADSFEIGSSFQGASATLLDGQLRFRLVEIGQDGGRHTTWTPADGMPIAIELTVQSDRRGDTPAGPIIMSLVARAPAVSVRSTSGH